MKKLYFLVILVCTLFIFTGCNLLNSQSSTDLHLLNHVPQTGNANLKLQIVLPGDKTNTIKPAIRCATDGQATLKASLISVFPGTEGNSQTSLIQKEVPVSADGEANISFSALPETPVIAKIIINGGNLSGKTDFHGASDLKSGDNTLEVSPTGSGHSSDIAAGVMLETIKNPEIVKAAPKNLVSTILNSAQNSINQNLTGSELYQDAFNQFITNNLSRLTTLTILQTTSTGGLKTSEGSWDKEPAEIWSGITEATGLKARQIIRQGLTASKMPIVSFSEESKVKFALALINPETGEIEKYFISDGSSLSNLSAIQVLPEENSIILSAVANGLPVLIKWNMANSVVTGWPVTETSVEWTATFPGLTADSKIPYPEVEQMLLEPSERTTLNCVVRDPKTMMLINFDVSLAGVVEARIDMADIAMHSLTAFAGNQEITLHWDSIPIADYYTLYWSNLPEVPTTGDNVNAINRVSRPFIHTGLTADTTYYYKLTWTIDGTESGESQVASATPWYFASPQILRVIYYGNGQTLGREPIDPNYYAVGSQATILGQPEFMIKDGYLFKSWNTKEDGSGNTYQPGDTYTFTDAHLELYAFWEPETITISYDGNGSTGGTVPVDNNVYQANATITVLENTGNLTRELHEFNGWNTRPDGSGSNITPGSNFRIGNSSITFYARWRELNPLSFSSMGHDSGIVPSDENVYAVGDTVTVPGNTGELTKEGYRFGGWKSTSTGAIYNAGQTFSMTEGGVTLEPVWYSNSEFTLSYNSNGATGGSAPSDSTLTHGNTVTVPGNSGSLSNGDKTFYGWNTAPDGSGMEYIQGSTFIMPESDVTLYAVWDAFAGGDGTAANPYQVANAAQLNRVRNFQALNFIQIADIDLGVYPYNSGWEPIGSSSYDANYDSMKFSGSYDGNSNSINNLYINKQTQDAVGLFGYADGATIENLTVYNADVTGGDNVGILAGKVLNTRIRDCRVLGKAQAVGLNGFSQSGGLVGYAMDTDITNCGADAVVTGADDQGGLIGSFITNNRAATIAYCMAGKSVISNGTDIGKGTAGGLVGSVSAKSDAKVTIEHSSSNATVEGFYGVGGLIGDCGAYTNIYGCYATGNVTVDSNSVTAGSVGGLIGINAATIDISYAEGSVSSRAENAGGLIGNNKGIVSKSYASGDVTSSADNVGGFTGYNEGNISDSYSQGDVTGNFYPAGFCGFNANNAIISRCYSSGALTALSSTPFPKGFAHSDFLIDTITDCYWDTTTSGTTESEGDATGLTTAEMQTQASYSNWDFSDTWYFTSGSYPTLR